MLAAAAQLNYRPNRAARTIRTGRSDTVQLSLHMLSDPWSLAVAAAVNEEANRHGLTTLILADGDWYAALDRVESDVAYLDGAVDTDDGRRKLRTLVERGQRLVVFSETLEPDGYDVIRSDAIPGCFLAMDHLLERHTEIGCLVADSAFRGEARRSRYTPYLDRMRARGLPIDRVAHRRLLRAPRRARSRRRSHCCRRSTGPRRSTPRPTSPRSRRSTRRTCSGCECRTTSP